MKRKLDLFEYNDNDGVGRLRAITPLQEIAIAEKLEANMMTKAQFNALAEERKANRAGSGFDEWGVYNATGSATTFFGSGTSVRGFQNMIVSSMTGGSWDGTFFSCFGKNSSSIISGVTHKHAEASAIRVPTAPTIYPHDTVLTTEQINSGVIKHADASNSGLIANGKFDTDTSGWTVYNSGTIAFSSNKALITSGDTNYGGALQTISGLSIGKKYILTFEVSSSVGNRAVTITNSDKASGVIQGSNNGLFTIEFIPTSSSCSIIFQGATSTTFSGLFDNVAVYPADAISRSDLVFLESWHEDISEKNFVYPLGNTQYLGGNTDGLTGIANGAFTGFETYSLFGNWQAPSALIGKGYVWSNLTEAQKRAFIANPDNNCYLDGDKVIQVRYRVRVVQGLGDSWKIDGSGNINPDSVNGWVETGFGGANFYLAPKGKKVYQDEFSASFPTYRKGITDLVTLGYAGIGHYYALQSVNANDVSAAYEGKCFALPIALVHRRNQGMYHPTYNPNGSKKASDDKYWYETSVSFTSISDCFNPDKLLANSGTIASGKNGRPDNRYADNVHESDIIDLRNSSKKVEDYNRLISREFNNLVAGTTRGKESEWKFFASGTTTSFTKATNFWVYGAVPASVRNLPLKRNDERLVFVKDNTGIWYVGYSSYSDATSLNIYFNYSMGGTFNQVTEYLIFDKSTRTKSNTLLHCDIIGNPTNYPTSWKESGVFGTPLIVAEDGTSLLPDGVRDTFKLSRKANATPLLCLRSTDNGATWTSFTPTFNTTTNEITLTDEPAGNLVMVYYQTHTIMAVPVANNEVIEIGEVFHTESAYADVGGVLLNSLISKVSILISHPSRGRGALQSFNIYFNLFDINNTYSPTHQGLGMPTSSAPAVKVFPYLTRKNGKAYLNLVFKEMKHNGTSWGDDNKFNIVDNVSTTTDNNAQTILIGQKTVELPYFIGADE